VSKHDAAFPYDLYRFFIRPIREADAAEQGNLLERALNRCQWWFEWYVNLAQFMPVEVTSPGAAREELLPALLWQVGWDDSLSHVIDRISVDDKRRLIVLACALWKEKGTEGGYRDAIRLLTGRDPEIENWFFYRWIVGETGTWWDFQGADPWIVGGTLTDLDEFLSSLLIMDEGGLDYTLIEDLVGIMRPLGEHVDIVYLDFVDNFRLGLGLWTTLLGSILWKDGTNTAVLPSGSWANADSVLSSTWGPTPVIMANFIPNSPTQVFRVYLNFDLTPGLDWYYAVEVNLNAGVVRVWMKPTGFGEFPVITQPLTTPITPGDLSQITIQVTDPAPIFPFSFHFRVWIDSVLVIDWPRVPQVAWSGTFGIRNFGPGDLEIDNVRLFNPPLRVDEVGP